MAHVLYIQPWNTSSYEDAAKLSGSIDGLMIPRAMFEVACRLTNAGHTVDLLDCNLPALANPQDPITAVQTAIRHRFAQCTYDWVFISWPTVAQGNIVQHVAGGIKNLSHASIVIGGAALELLGKDVTEYIPMACYCYAGDGIEIPEMLDHNGTFGRNGSPGLLQMGPDSPFTPAKREILDGYDAAGFYTVHGTFDFQGYLNMYRTVGIQPVGLLEMMRGCPHACSYCAIRGEVAGVRYRDPATVAGEVEFLLRLGVNRYYVIDPTFGLHKKKTAKLLDRFAGLKARYPSFGWWGITRCDCITEDIAPRLKVAGAHTMSIGVETMDQTTLNDVHKRTSSQTSRDAVQILHRQGITARLLLMHFPEVPDTQTIRFLLEAHRSGGIILQSSMLRLLYQPGCRNEQEIEDFDFRQCDHEVDGRAAGLDTNASVLGYLLVNLAFPSTSIRPDGDAALRERLEGAELDVWFRAVNASADKFESSEKLALGLLRVGYDCAEAATRIGAFTLVPADTARRVVDSVRQKLLGNIPERNSPLEWLGIVASVNPPRWYYRPSPTEPFPQLWSGIKVGENLEDLDRLVLETSERR